MKLTIEPTGECTKIEGATCRIWRGVDGNGTEVKVWVRTLSPQTHDQALLEAFDRELKELPPMRPGAIDYRFIAD